MYGTIRCIGPLLRCDYSRSAEKESITLTSVTTPSRTQSQCAPLTRTEVADTRAACNSALRQLTESDTRSSTCVIHIRFRWRALRIFCIRGCCDGHGAMRERWRCRDSDRRGWHAPEGLTTEAAALFRNPNCRATARRSVGHNTRDLRAQSGNGGWPEFAAKAGMRSKAQSVAHCSGARSTS